MEECQNCLAWVRKNEKLGDCRRHAPIDSDFKRPPVTNSDYGCLEFVPLSKTSKVKKEE